MILHIVSRAEWEAAQGAGRYAPASLEREGFIHFSTPGQVLGIVVLEPQHPGAAELNTGIDAGMAVGIEQKGESYGLVIDSVGEVLRLSSSSQEPNPSNLDKRWAEISGGVHRLDGKLMIILDVARLFSAMVEQPKAAA